MIINAKLSWSGHPYVTLFFKGQLYSTRDKSLQKLIRQLDIPIRSRRICDVVSALNEYLLKED